MIQPITSCSGIGFLAPDALVSICMESMGITFLQFQLERDFTAKALGWRPVGFTLFELLEIHALLPETIENVVMTHAEHELIAQYCAYHLKIANDCEDTERAKCYDNFLDALLVGATLITFQL